MSNTDLSFDIRMRAAAFQHVRRLQKESPHVTRQQLKQGFVFDGERVPLVDPQRGIFKPRRMEHLLSILTVFPRPGRENPYDDVFEDDETVQYAFMGKDPQAPNNQWLRKASESTVPVPVIYFVGIAPGCYQAVLPVFITDWKPDTLKASVALGPAREEALIDREPISYAGIAQFPDDPRERHYALRVQKARLHQASFRKAVLSVYKDRCAVTGLPEPQLLDAAHIIPDKDERLGQPVIENGIPLSKIHHAAFDSHLIGIDPDYHIHVSDRLREKEDGPLLESLKGFGGNKIYLPRREIHRPDRNRLAMRFEQYQDAN